MIHFAHLSMVYLWCWLALKQLGFVATVATVGIVYLWCWLALKQLGFAATVATVAIVATVVTCAPQPIRHLKLKQFVFNSKKLFCTLTKNKK